MTNNTAPRGDELREALQLAASKLKIMDVVLGELGLPANHVHRNVCRNVAAECSKLMCDCHTQPQTVCDFCCPCKGSDALAQADVEPTTGEA